jgi:RNA polymerase sigma-70 factor (ECF subfamily)
MGAAKPIRGERHDVSPGTLGAVLYADTSQTLVSESEWVALVRAIAAGELQALHGLYDRSHRIVFTLSVRITGNRETAEEVTLDVFHDVWRRAAQYQPANGTVLGWVMNQARSRAIDRLRFDQRKKRVAPCTDEPGLAEAARGPQETAELQQQARLLHQALAGLSPHEREAIEKAFFSELTYAEVAARLDAPLGTVKTRIRSGLHKLRKAMTGEAER